MKKECTKKMVKLKDNKIKKAESKMKESGKAWQERDIKRILK